MLDDCSGVILDRAMRREDLEERVKRAAEAALAEQQYVSAIDVLLGLGWLAPTHLQQWRQGRIESLERVVQANLNEVTVAMAASAGGRGTKDSTRQRPTRSPVPATAASCASA
jgi:hypothetical protein